MAVDIKILKLLGEQDKRQSKDRQISSDHMVNSNRILESVNESVRYNISQSNSLKSGLGEVTSKLIKEVKTGKGDSQIDSSKSPTVRKLDEIKLILESQSKLLEKSINSQFESDPTEITDPNAKDEKDNDKEGENKDKDNNKKSSSLIDRLFKAIAGPALMAAGAALALVVSPFIEPFTRLYDTIKTLPGLAGKAINGAKAAWNAIKSRSSKIFSKISAEFPKVVNKFKNAVSKASNAIKNFGSKISGAAGKIGNFIKNIGSKALDIGKSLLDKGKSLLDKGKNLASKAGSWAKGAAGKAGNIVTKIPGVKSVLSLAKGAGAVLKRLPLLSAGLEAAETAKIVRMAPEERKKYLGDIVKEMEGKSGLSNAWYAFNNPSKTIAAWGQEEVNAKKLEEEIEEGNKETLNLQERLIQAKLHRNEKDKQEAEKLKAEPIADQAEKEKESLKFFKEYNKRLEDPEFMRNLPILPSNTTINQSTVTVPGSDYGNTIRRGNK